MGFVVLSAQPSVTLWRRPELQSNALGPHNGLANPFPGLSDRGSVSCEDRLLRLSHSQVAFIHGFLGIVVLLGNLTN